VSLRNIAAILLIVVLAVPGCAARKVKPESQVEAIQAQGEVPEAQLLDVGIQVLDPGLGEVDEIDEMDLEAKGIFTDLRKAESRYIAYRLKETLEATGHWGAVRVVPEETANVDLLVSGEIVASTGLELVLELRAMDATGEEWLERKYKGKADPRAYRTDDEEEREGRPFQSTYNVIANDLLALRQEREPSELKEVRAVSQMRFAADLAPEAFDGYLGEDKKGRYVLEGLPAEGDPMLARVDAIRERDYLLVDTLNEHYASFHDEMEGSYGELQAFSYEELLALKKIKKQRLIGTLIGVALLAGSVAAGGGDASTVEQALADTAAIAGFLVIQSSLAKSKELKIHVEGLRELAASFDAEITPALVDVEGETLRLTGSAEEQYVEWRRLLREIFVSETGLPLEDPGGEAVSTPADRGSSPS
jgi:hypothetical protein